MRGFFDLDKAQKRLAELDELSLSPTFWDDNKTAQKILKERSYLKNSVDAILDLTSNLDSFLELVRMGEEENDEATINEAYSELQKLAETAKVKQIESLFSGEVDSNDCFVEIHSGAGGTESHDWAEMLFRMYCRWAERHNYKVDLIDKFAGEEAGIKTATIKISGANAYGWLKTESGVHRLVRISPFNSAGKRHTSFASAWVYPVIDDSFIVEIKESDLRIDTYRSSGAGGQHVNTTDSAVRITHLPTNIVVQSQSNRSQHKNKDECYSMLRSRLYELEMQNRADKASVENSKKSDIGWSNQIRSYVLHPYQMVKDTRTSYEDSDSQGVLDGKIDEFLKCTLEKNAQGQGFKFD